MAQPRGSFTVASAHDLAICRARAAADGVHFSTMRTALKCEGAWTASSGHVELVGAIIGLGVAIGVAGCGRTDTILYVDGDQQSTTFSYEGDGDGDGDGDTTDTDDPVCGNGIAEQGEDCDDQNSNNNDSCTNNCLFNVCGDGFLFEGVEECDPGAANIGPNEACVPGCKVNVCGDGFVGPGELCDDGNPFDGDGCNNDCTTGTCGNGIIDPGEECDDQNLSDGDGCLSTCVLAKCGDGALWIGVEECDDGPFNSNGAQCTLACKFNICGDGNLWQGVEECDPGPGQIGPGMECLTGCVQNGCGDADPGPGEECDDGNADNTDDCTTMCLAATCGDGFVWAGVEDCDDQNNEDNDACHNDCSANAVVEVRAGGNHTCARFNNGALSCWGNGHNGRTGYATEENLGDDEPAGSWGVVDIGEPITSVETAVSHTCVRHAGGQVRCFGRASDGQLGYGNVVIIGDDEQPSSVGFVDLGGPTAFIAADGGAFHTCAVMQTGAVICWGRNTDGRLGYALGPLNESVGDDETPAEFVAQHGTIDVGGDVIQIVNGNGHTCALLDDATVRCWGLGDSGQLGYGNGNFIGDNETPASAGAVPVGDAVASLGGGWYHTCAVLQTGQVKCWGRGNDGRLGYGNVAWVGLSVTPASVGFVDVGGLAVKIDCGNAHTCALLDDGTIRCWGWGGRGQLGYGNTVSIGDNEAPASAGPVEIGGLALDITVDGNHTCALREDGKVLCWGDGGDGRLGYGNTDYVGDDELPASVGPVPLF